MSSYENKNIEVKSQMSFELVEPKESEIENKIKELDPLNMTPIEALNTIYELKNKLKD